MRLNKRIVPYLQMVSLYHLTRLNETWFKLDEPLVSAFVERWHPKMHTFHMSFRECTITLQDVAYQLKLPIDGHHVSGCLTDFVTYIEGGHPTWTWFEELLGLLPPANCIDKFAVWLPYVARLEDMGGCSWGSAALSWLYRCMCHMASRHGVKLARPLQLLQS
ncbi:protein MAIN-LIKE 2-like [Arachis hypogaea]|uniref:protein MAIN-LIKE 2-like n=1 Tax=Arachis hypogaea TaxID=3818 RepID=UPI000DECA57A|nr:protein MAIN-LIKE 2-like [Arachis hypogaea]